MASPPVQPVVECFVQEDGNQCADGKMLDRGKIVERREQIGR
jgi:hypothetical protein